MSDFIKQYTNYSDTQLLQIIEDATNYQPLAVETAQTILNARMLSNEEIECMKAALAQKKEEQETKRRKLFEFKNKIKNTGTSVLDALNPIQTEKPETEKLIAIICLVFSMLFLFHLYTHFGIIRFMFFEIEVKWDLDIALYFLPLLTLPIALVLFFWRKKIGLILLSIFLTYTAVHIFGVYLLERYRISSGIPAINNTVYPKAQMATQLLLFVFYTGALYRICQEDIRKMFNVSLKKILLSIAITVVLSVMIAYRILLFEL